ncbi:MAG TPA: hypothetical protein ENK57_10470 [Polyangiaceae bacterium]|nr:hypothetical protein [Polyangiaceae bacterium]
MKPVPNPVPLDEAPEAPASGAQWRAPALDVATLDRAEGEGYLAVLPDGTTRPATLSAVVDPELAEQCLREQRPMLVRAAGDELQIVGALQTQASPLTTRDGVVTLTGRRVQLEAEQDVILSTGADTRLSLARNGKFSLIGERLTMHVASLVKIIGSRVELP